MRKGTAYATILSAVFSAVVLGAPADAGAISKAYGSMDVRLERNTGTFVFPVPLPNSVPINSVSASADISSDPSSRPPQVAGTIHLADTATASDAVYLPPSWTEYAEATGTSTSSVLPHNYELFLKAFSTIDTAPSLHAASHVVSKGKITAHTAPSDISVDGPAVVAFLPSILDNVFDIQTVSGSTKNGAAPVRASISFDETIVFQGDDGTTHAVSKLNIVMAVENDGTIDPAFTLTGSISTASNTASSPIQWNETDTEFLWELHNFLKPRPGYVWGSDGLSQVQADYGLTSNPVISGQYLPIIANLYDAPSGTITVFTTLTSDVRSTTVPESGGIWLIAVGIAGNFLLKKRVDGRSTVA